MVYLFFFSRCLKDVPHHITLWWKSDGFLSQVYVFLKLTWFNGWFLYNPNILFFECENTPQKVSPCHPKNSFAEGILAAPETIIKRKKHNHHGLQLGENNTPPVDLPDGQWSPHRMRVGSYSDYKEIPLVEARMSSKKRDNLGTCHEKMPQLSMTKLFLESGQKKNPPCPSRRTLEDIFWSIRFGCVFFCSLICGISQIGSSGVWCKI